MVGTELKMAFGDLDRGELYPIKSAVRTNATLRDGRKVDGVKANIEYCGVPMFTYLPKVFVKKDDAFWEAVNAAGNTDKPYNVVYYGSWDIQNIGKIHAPGEGRDEAEFRKWTAIMNKRAAKRKMEGGQDGAGPTKSFKVE